MTQSLRKSLWLLVHRSEQVLKNTPEEWLEFSAGQNTRFNLKRFQSSSVTALIRQFVGFAYLLMVSFRPRTHQTPQKDVVFFASSQNQYSVLQPVYEASLGISKVFIVPRVYRPASDIKLTKVVEFGLGLVYVAPVLLLLVKRTPSLLMTLFAIDKRLIVLRLKSFWSIYLWLVYHQVLLDNIRPKLVMLSNDHNPEARTLIEMCKIRGIKTGYIPHAGVSPRFHSLDFDFSFLDGKHAMSIYRNCEDRRSTGSKIISRRLCFLVGNLRKIVAPKKPRIRTQRYGLAVKGTDKISCITTMILRLSAHAPVVVRPHPNLKASTYRRLLSKLELENVELSDPREEEPSVFLSSITTLICGNSTLLLEAASVGRLPIYLGELSGGVHDYYGYVSRGVANYYRDVEGFLYHQTAAEDSLVFRADEEGIRHYWTSFKTSFENQEAKIIADFLSQIVRGAEKFDSKFNIEILEMANTVREQ